MNGVHAVQESHAGANIPDYTPRLLLGERFLRLPQHRKEISTREKLHDEHHAIWQRRHGPVHVDRVQAPKADHGFQLPQKRSALAHLLLGRFHVRGALVAGDVQNLCGAPQPRHGKHSLWW